MGALLARVSPQDLRQAEELLPPQARQTFRQMSVPDQRHALNVMLTLRRSGHTEIDLAVAALLHDVGKSAAQITPVHRTLIVLSERFAPRMLAWLSRGEPRGWRRPFVIHRQHAQLGAEWAARVGCSPLTVSLIRRHHELLHRAPMTEEERLLAALQCADGIN